MSGKAPIGFKIKPKVSSRPVLATPLKLPNPLQKTYVAKPKPPKPKKEDRVEYDDDTFCIFCNYVPSNRDVRCYSSCLQIKITCSSDFFLFMNNRNNKLKIDKTLCN